MYCNGTVVCMLYCWVTSMNNYQSNFIRYKLLLTPGCSNSWIPKLFNLICIFYVFEDEKHIFRLTLFWFTPLAPCLRNVISHTEGGILSLYNINIVYIDVQKIDCFFSHIFNASQCTTLEIWDKKWKLLIEKICKKTWLWEFEIWCLSKIIVTKHKGYLITFIIWLYSTPKNA